MKQLAKSDVRYWQQRLFRHSRQVDGQTFVDTNWSVRIAYQNRRDRFQLGTSNKYEAARTARFIYQNLVAKGWLAVRAEFKAKRFFGPPGKNPTIGEFLSELRVLHASKRRTIDSYAGSLRKIAADIAGISSGGTGGSPKVHRVWREKVEALKLSVLSPVKIQKWKEAFLIRAGDDPVQQRSARISVNSFLREARTLFSPRYLEGSEMVLPENPFAGIKLERRSMPRYQSDFDVLELVRAACDELASTRPEEFKVFTLAVMSGLRRNEIDKLEWIRFNWSAGTINITPTRFFRTKSIDSTRTVPIPPQMLEMFRDYHLKAKGPFVIESAVKPDPAKPYDHYRSQKTFDALIAWLRSKGVRGEKPLHTLRKEFGSLIAAKFGIYSAKELLGHSDIATTAGHYLEAKERPMIGLGHLLPTAAVSPSAASCQETGLVQETV
jgi:integrase